MRYSGLSRFPESSRNFQGSHLFLCDEFDALMQNDAITVYVHVIIPTIL